jgi:hypothetical protein
MPETEKRILFEHDGEDSKKFRAYIEALNLDEPIKIAVKNG